METGSVTQMEVVEQDSNSEHGLQTCRYQPMSIGVQGPLWVTLQPKRYAAPRLGPPYESPGFPVSENNN